MNEKSVSRISAMTKAFWIYHLLSAGIGVLLLFMAIQKNAVANLSAIPFIILLLLYVPLLLVSYQFIKLKKWAYFAILLLYAMETIKLPPHFELQLTFFSYSLVATVKGFQFGINIVSAAVLSYLLAVGKEYLNQAR